MSIKNLDALFNPKRIALIGVSPNPQSVSGSVLRNLINGGFRGVVYPVNPASEAVMGISCYPDVATLPRTPDLAIICTASDKVPETVLECGEKGVRCIIVITAGFRETGPEGRELEQQIAANAAKFPGMRILGPNCLGVIAPKLKLNASFAGDMPKAGNVAFISQSGALCTSVLDWALQENIGFSYFVSVGNGLDVDFADLIDYFGEDDQTKSIILYIESIQDARKFMTANRAFARTKPIVAYKAGRFPESAQAAASHTGAMAAEDDVYEAAFDRAGIVRVYDIGDIFDCAELIGRHKPPAGPRLGIVTNAGGPGVMATDALIANNGVLADLTPETMDALNENLPPSWSHANPVDVLGDARSKRLAKAVRIVAADKNTDALLVILTPQSMTNPTAAAREIVKLSATTSKPILAAWLGGRSMKEGMEILSQNNIPTYQTPEQAIRAFMFMTHYSRNLETLYETPRDIPVKFNLDKNVRRHQFDAVLPDSRGILSEIDSKTILDSYGVTVTVPRMATTVGEAVAAADAIGYPVVMKIHSPDITHKSDMGGVVLDIGDAEAVRQQYVEMMATVGAAQPDARLQGVTIQKMATHSGVELILGIKQDPVFGSVVMVGLGGTEAELMADRSLGFPPLNERLTRRMLESLKAWPLLNGYRGKPPVNLDRLIETIMRVSYMAADYPEIEELDINPLLVDEEGVLALDARIVATPRSADDAASTRPYSHLALRPYPDEFCTETTLKDGTLVRLRPIRPEDEPLWMNLLRSCSRESIYMRFRYMFQWESHAVASRYCYIDYDREIAIVAEIEEAGERKLVGVGRLVCEPGVETGEYAVLIADAYQNRGIGGRLTDFCLDIARDWGLTNVVAQTTTDNDRMIKLFENRAFKIQREDRGELLDVRKALNTEE